MTPATSNRTLSHTPAPWIVWEPEFETRNGGSAVTLVVARENPTDVNQEIAYVHCRSCYLENSPMVPVASELVKEAFAPEEALANAYLIAAAPELLAACEALHVRLFREQGGQPNSKWASPLRLLSKVIRKAKGQM